MMRQSLLAANILILAGCAGAGGPIYEFRPADVQRYQLSEHGALTVDTPVGQQTATDSTRATIAIEIAGSTEGGREVVVSFDALEFWSGGDFPRQHITGDDLVNQPFRGVLNQAGEIKVTEMPDVPEALSNAIAPDAVFANVMPPLPPMADASLPSWPHRVTMKMETTMSVELDYDGTASFAGDTTWNGEAARVIVSEGIATASGHGTPAGSPGEIDFNYTGRYVTRYIWDPVRGIMLASRSTTEAEGDLEVVDMQMIMPITYQSRSDVTLQR
jgi:hypothetical protein